MVKVDMTKINETEINMEEMKIKEIMVMKVRINFTLTPIRGEFKMSNITTVTGFSSDTWFAFTLSCFNVTVLTNRTVFVAVTFLTTIPRIHIPMTRWAHVTLITNHILQTVTHTIIPT